MLRHVQPVELGKARIPTTRLGLGTAPIGGMFEHVADEQAIELVRAAVDAGIVQFDTAPFYGHGVAERRLGAGLAAANAVPQLLSTKVGRLLVAGAPHVPGIYVDAAAEQPVFDYTADGVRRSLDESLQRLNVDHVDLVLIHDPDDYADQAIGEAYPALEQLRSEGVIKAIGVGMNQTAIPTRFVTETDIDAVLIAGRYTLLDQQAQDDLFPAALARNVSIMAAGVYNSGILADPRPGATYNYESAPTELIDRAIAIRDVLARFDVPLTAAAIQFPLRHPAVTVVLTGSRSADELRRNIADFDRDIPDEAWHELEQRGFVASVDA